MGQANNSTPPNESYVINPMPLRMMPPPGYQNPRRRTNDPSIDQVISFIWLVYFYSFES